MKNITLSFLLVVLTLIFSTQKISGQEDMIFMVVEKMPEFPGGNPGLLRYLSSNIKYDNINIEEDYYHSKIYVRFYIDETGKAMKPEILRGCKNTNIIEVIEKMPRWKPGEQRGKKVKVWYTVPIHIHLE